MKKDYKIAVAGTGYVGLSIATLLSQTHHVTAVDIIPEKVEITMSAQLRFPLKSMLRQARTMVFT